jgi:hypothetical protein
MEDMELKILVALLVRIDWMLDILLILRFSLGIYFKFILEIILITFIYCWNFGATFVLLELLLNWGVILECEDTFVCGVDF